MQLSFRFQGRGHCRRRGAITVLAAFLLVAVLMIVACALDTGYMMNVRTELQAAADASALAGAGAIDQGQQEAIDAARQFATANQPQSYHKKKYTVEIETGRWDRTSKTFNISRDGEAVSVVIKRMNEPFFFARIMGQTGFSTEVKAIAIPTAMRDVMFVLDASQSMNDESELKSISKLGRVPVEQSLKEIFSDLGSPKFGTMTWTPQWVTIKGKSSNGASQPDITVTFQGESVYVTSSKDLSNVVLGFSRGGQQKFEGLTGLTGTFKGAGSYAGQRVEKVWVKSGSNKSGGGPGYGELFQNNGESIKKALRLDEVPYPYPSGSWGDYVSYVQTNSSNHSAGYRDKYGYLNFVDYLLQEKPAHDQTPDLWKTRSQPMANAKEASNTVLKALQGDGRASNAGLIVFNSNSGGGYLESSLQENLEAIGELMNERQASHYASPANLGRAIEAARDELVAKGRRGSTKLMILVSNGLANQPLNSTDPRRYALEEAQRAAAAGIHIVAISVGTNADQALLDEIATITKGAFLAYSDSLSLQQQLSKTLRDLTPTSSPRLVY